MFYCFEEAKELVYFALVRPHVEYACSLWDPSSKTLINKLEMVQRRSLRFVCNEYRREEGIVAGLIERKGWLSLKDRRLVARMCMLYKIVNENVAIRFSDYFNFKRSSTRSSHNFIISRPTCTSELVRNSFFYQSIIDWNRLDSDMFVVDSCEKFKLHLLKSFERGQEQTRKQSSHQHLAVKK